MPWYNYKTKLIMKLLKTVFLLLFVFTLSCSSSDDSDDQQQQDGTLSITFSDGRSFIMDDITATLSNNENSFPFAVQDGGFYVTLNYIDNESTFNALTGTLDILDFNANGNNSQLTAVFNTSNGNGLLMSGNLSAINLTCTECE